MFYMGRGRARDKHDAQQRTITFLQKWERVISERGCRQAVNEIQWPLVSDACGCLLLDAVWSGDGVMKMRGAGADAQLGRAEKKPAIVLLWHSALVLVPRHREKGKHSFSMSVWEGGYKDKL